MKMQRSGPLPGSGGTAVATPSRDTDVPQGDVGNAALLEGMTAEEQVGPFDSPLLNAALAMAFDEPLDGLRVEWNAGETDQAGALGITEGEDVTLHPDIGEDLGDPLAMEVIGHEVAHALAGGGSGETELDGPGDPGETGADVAGRAFAMWALSGFAGTTPSLAPAEGGKATRHRYSSGVLDGSPMLRRGSSGGDVSTLQSLLNQLGHGLVVDGEFGPMTETSVRSFQASRGLMIDGIVGPQTAGALNAAVAGGNAGQDGHIGLECGELTGVPMLRNGSRGSQVRLLQECLNDHGYRCGIDGIFGPETERTVKAYQADHGLEVDGIVGPITAGSLSEGAAPAPTPDPGGPVEEEGPSVLTGDPPLRRGDEGPLVEELQRLLTGAGFPTTADGDFGPITQSNLTMYQVSRGLEGTGIAGVETVDALKSGAPQVADPVPGGLSDLSYDPKGALNSPDVAPSVRELAKETALSLQAAGYAPYISEAHRSFERQDDLYAQGRTKDGPVVTWVQGGGSWHNYGLAVDIVFWNDGGTGPSWEEKHPWHLVGEFGLSAGFSRWGGSFGDRPHLEHHPKHGNSCYDLQGLLASEGLPAVWDEVGA